MENSNNHTDRTAFRARLSKLIEALEMSASQFARELGYERPEKVYAMLKGKFLPSYDTLLAILDRFGEVNVDWLVRGRGSMFVKETLREADIALPVKKTTEEKILPALSEKIKLLESQLTDKEKIIKLLEKQLKLLERVPEKNNKAK
jgi:transcriptional regulator with XRE-family HTH domain